MLTIPEYPLLTGTYPIVQRTGRNLLPEETVLVTDGATFYKPRPLKVSMLVKSLNVGLLAESAEKKARAAMTTFVRESTSEGLTKALNYAQRHFSARPSLRPTKRLKPLKPVKKFTKKPRPKKRVRRGTSRGKALRILKRPLVPEKGLWHY